MKLTKWLLDLLQLILTGIVLILCTIIALKLPHCSLNTLIPPIIALGICVIGIIFIQFKNKEQ